MEGGLMAEKQRLESFIQDDIKAPIQRLIENGDIESAEILIYTRIDTMRHLTPSLFETDDGDGVKYGKWVREFMPLDYGKGIVLKPEELWVTRCDYVHNGGASERHEGTRRIVLRKETAPENSCEQNEVEISMRDFVINFGIATRECYQWICADESRLSAALEHLMKMKYVRGKPSVIGILRTHSWDKLSDEQWRLFYDLGGQHVVECTFYLYNFLTGNIETADKDQLENRIKGFDNLSVSNEVLGTYDVETTALLWEKEVTDEDFTSDELLKMACDDFDRWYRNSGAHKRYNVAAIGGIRTTFCQHGKQRLTAHSIRPYRYQQTPMIP